MIVVWACVVDLGVTAGIGLIASELSVEMCSMP